MKSSRTNRSLWTTRAMALSGAAGLAVSAGHSSAAIISWNNVAGGSASVAANWNPTQLPTAADTLQFNLAGTYTVTYNSTVTASTSHTYSRGTVTLSLTSPHTVSGAFRVGITNALTGTATITTGDLTAGSVAVGDLAGAVGVLNVNDARLFTSGSGDVVIGATGTGTLSVTGGGTVESADDIILGSAGGNGTVNVSGFGTSPLRFSSIRTTAADGDIIVGNSSGTVSELNVFGSGFVTSSDDVIVGHVGGASGLIDVGGPSGGGTLTVNGDLQIGNNSTATSAGSGQVAALADGVINVTGAIRLGDTTFGSGTLTCRDGGEINATSIFCDDDGGFLNFLGGVVTVDSGTLTTHLDTLEMDGPNNTETPLLRLINGASCTLSTTTSPFRALELASSEHAEIHVESGSSFRVTNGDSVLGVLAGSLGILQYTGSSTGSFDATRTLTLGKGGEGGMLVSTGCVVSSGAINLGELVGGDGSLIVSGAGAQLNMTGRLIIGGTPTGTGGTGSVTIGPGGSLSATSSGNDVHVRTTGDLTVQSGGRLEGVNVGVNGAMTLTGGIVDCTTLDLNPPSARGYNFHGTVDGGLFVRTNATLALTGGLAVGQGGSALDNLGTITVGNHTLTIVGTNSFQTDIGNCTLGATGVVTSAAQPLQLLAGKTLSGDGTVNATVNNAGTITATGDGLTFGGIVHGVGQGMNGVRFTFASGGGFTGAGSINAKVVGQPGSTLTITGNASLGDGTTGGFTTDGEIDITAGNLILSDSNGVGLGTLTTIRSGATLTCASAINVNSTPTLDVIEGQGGFVNGTLNCSGLLRPGFVSGDPTGTFAVLGGLGFQSGTFRGEAQIELGGTAQADRDRVSATGPITLDGTLTVTLINGFVPANGFSAAVMSSTQSVAGSFLTTNLPPRFHVELDAKNVFVVFCAADFDNDGFISGDDFDQYVAAFESGDPASDFNQDGFISGDDFDGFIVAFEEGC